MTAIRIALTALYVATIPAAAWLVVNVGVVNVGLGLMAPAAVYIVGLTLVLRDLLQRLVGKTAIYALILIGAALSALVSPQLAAASAAAFLVSETIDFAIFTALDGPGHRFYTAVAVSGAVALAVDSLIFLIIAFGNLDFLPGQIVGKAAATAAALAVLALLRAHRLNQPRPAPKTLHDAIHRDLYGPGYK